MEYINSLITAGPFGSNKLLRLCTQNTSTQSSSIGTRKKLGSIIGIAKRSRSIHYSQSPSKCLLFLINVSYKYLILNFKRAMKLFIHLNNFIIIIQQKQKKFNKFFLILYANVYIYNFTKFFLNTKVIQSTAKRTSFANILIFPESECA